MTNSNKLTIATEIFQKLLVNGVINKSKDNKMLFESYYDTDVREYLDILTSTMGFETFVQNDNLYMFAKTTSDFAPTNSDMREKLKGCENKNSKLYLAEIIFVVFLSEIFSGSNSMRLKREFIPIDELIVSVKNAFDSIEEKEYISENTGMNFTAAKKEWENLLIEPKDAQAPNSRDRVGFTQNTMNLFGNEGLVEKINEVGKTNFYPTTKLKDFVSSGKFDEERFKSIINPLEER